VLEGERLAATHIQAGTQLRSNLVYSLGFDRRGWLWAGTDNGIDVSRPEGWRHYSQADGVAWNDTNLNALVAGRGGDVWIGTNRGLSRFLGSESGREHTPPNVMLTSVRFGDRAAETGSFAEVPFADRSLHISFTATTFHDEPEVRFRYRLSGLSDRWVTTAKRDLHFAGLPARRYELEIMACSARGVWSRQPARFEFRILSPWYMRWWLLASAAGILMLLTRGVHRWRLRRLLRNQSRLEAMVADRTRELSDAKIRAEESSRAKSAFLAIMSHEIRTPLNGVLGMTSLVLDGELTAEQRDNLEISKRSGESLLALLDDILDLSRIEAGRLPLNTAPFSLPDCVELAMQTLAVEARQKGLDFTSSIAADLPAWISGDRTRLRQVLINLLGNAIKFTERGYVRLEVVGESSHDGQLEVRFSVKDSGVGVPPDKLVAIFEPFRQADSSTTRRYGGSGLGLAISARLVAMMGGRIWVESLPGEGSQFCFTARCAPAAAPVESRNPVEAADGRRPLRVLLAEDNKVNQKVAFRMLQKLGHEVVTAEDGRQAVEHFRDGGFDVVLMDIQMPEVDGFDATRSIRALERAVGQRTPIIAMTAFAMPGDRERCLEAGMDGYVAKPIAMEKLKQAIREVTGQPS
jgi:signal transduction histidine kinase/ActR/RegA family two-component response regulator